MSVADSRSRLRRTSSLYGALLHLARFSHISALYLHGLIPGMAAMRWLHSGIGRDVEVFFSPHGSRAMGQPMLIRVAVGHVLKLGLSKATRHTIVNLQTEADRIAPLCGSPVQLIESPVPQVFFNTPRREAKRPLLISCNLEGQRDLIDRFVRIAVLLNDDRLSITFNWVGTAEPEAAAALKAAGVGQFEAVDDVSRARRLGAAWIYVAHAEERGFPIRLAEAMAAGLPSVVWDTPVHRSVVEDGRTGYVCNDLSSMLQRIAELLDAPSKRRQMGHATRELARARFSEDLFRERILYAVLNAPLDAGRQ